MGKIRRNRIRSFLLIVSFALIVACGTLAKVEGVYFNLNFPNKEIVLMKEMFLIRMNPVQSPYYCTDTVATGQWQWDKDRNCVRLSSDAYQYSQKLAMSVSESIDMDTAKLYFEIDNPIESNITENGINQQIERAIYYSVIINGDCYAPASDSVLIKKFYTSKFTIKRVKDCWPNPFSIQIIPNNLNVWAQDQPPHIVDSFIYQPRDKNSNVFKIHMPNLTYCYMSAMRLKQAPVFLLGKNKIELFGEVYMRR